MRRGKIVHMIDALGHGGAERLLCAYVPRLAALGYNVEVLVLQDRHGNPMAGFFEEAGIPLRMLEVKNLRRVDQLFRSLRAIRDIRPDLIHAHLEFSSILASLARRTQGIPAVATLHTLDAPTAADRRSARRWLMYKALETSADRVIALTKSNADIAMATGLGKAKIQILPNGVEVDIYGAPPKRDRATIRTEVGIPLEAPLAISVCVLRPEKGIDRLIAAVPAVLARVPDAHFLVVGDGPEMDRLKALINTDSLRERVHFSGYRQDIVDLARASDVFVLPTLFDAQPTVIMEAMAAKLPVVASNLAGVPDMVGQGVEGLLTEPGDVPALADALSSLLGDLPRAQAMGDTGRRRVEADFAIDRQIERLADMYDALIAGRRVGS